MSKARLVITAVVVEGRSVSEVARTYGVARSWVYTLVARYRAEGDTAFEPRSRRPATRPDATPTATVELVLTLRQRLTRDGLDAGADTIAWHLEHHYNVRLSRATIYRIVRQANLELTRTSNPSATKRPAAPSAPPRNPDSSADPGPVAGSRAPLRRWPSSRIAFLRAAGSTRATHQSRTSQETLRDRPGHARQLRPALTRDSSHLSAPCPRLGEGPSAPCQL